MFVEDRDRVEVDLTGLTVPRLAVWPQWIEKPFCCFWVTQWLHFPKVMTACVCKVISKREMWQEAYLKHMQWASTHPV